MKGGVLWKGVELMRGEVILNPDYRRCCFSADDILSGFLHQPALK